MGARGRRRQSEARLSARVIAASPALRIVIGFSPGSASHDVAQAIMPALAANLRRSVTLEFCPGESGAIAARMVAAAAPDVSTLMMATLGTHALLPASNPACGYHPLGDFTPISLLLQAPLILVVPAPSGIRSIAALIEAARERPLTYGSSAYGGAPHVAAELFARRAGIKLRHARYSDTRQLYADLVAGKIDLSLNNLMSLLPLIRAGRLVALGTTDRKSHPALPDVPPIARIGLADVVMTNWVGLVGPAKLTQETVAEIEAALIKAEQESAIKAPEIVPATAVVFRTHLEHETRFWPPVIRDLDLLGSAP